MSNQQSTNGKSKGVSRREAIERVEEMVFNTLMSREAFLNRFFDRRRDLYDECGWPKEGEGYDAFKYQELYDREPLANRVVQVLPRESWQSRPSVYEEESAEKVTKFEEAWDSLGKSLRGEQSWYKDEEGSGVWEYLERADVESGIGRYGVILLGLDDGEELDQPAKFSPGPEAKSKLLYLRVFPESLTPINDYDIDPKSRRYGRPMSYQITFHDPRTSSASVGGAGMASASRRVHWTRVIHLADNLASSEVFGAPRMRPVLNTILDVQKVRGSSAEMYYKGAFPGLSIETHPQLGGDVEVSKSEMRDMIEQYQNGLQRFLSLIGFSAKSLSPQVVDPTPQLNAYIDAICIALDIPVRIFKGSERGELASSQDEGDWNGTLRRRQVGYLTPRVIMPFVDRLIQTNVLPEPESGAFCIEWPDVATQSDMEKADVAVKRTQALATYIQSGSEAVLTPMDFFTRWLGMDEEEARAILDSASERNEEEEVGSSPLARTVGGVTAVLEFFQKHKDAVIGEETLKQLLMMFYGVDEAKANAIIADGLPDAPVPNVTQPIPPKELGDGQKLPQPNQQPKKVNRGSPQRS